MSWDLYSIPILQFNDATRRCKQMAEKRHSYTNRLIHEKSPYLLQHAHNPVDWYPWGQEAFDLAKSTNKLIFISIGYATCHWCHVMEHESFEDVDVARLLNEAFVNIKIDREELPEIDSLYMEFAQSMMAGSAGWPLNVILTPELQPFFAATYLPPHSSHGLMGLTDLIARIQEVWISEERENILAQASKIVEVFAENVHYQGVDLPDKEQVDETADILLKMADPQYGGMKGAPKFPIGYQTNFMIRYSSLLKDSRALFLAERTLDMMQRGGIYDHLGGGFSRYSVDEKWLVPHFEKMLYDNALLIHAYLEAWQATQRLLYREITEEIIKYILRDMTYPEGGFYSAEDADSEGHEGLFYTWRLEEVQTVLGKEQSVLFCEYYDITRTGNFEGRNILNTPIRLEEFAQKKHRDVSELLTLFKEQKQILWKMREGRVHPLKDDKILTSWNGLMIFSLVEAGNAFNEKRYVDIAEQAARFLKKNLSNEEVLLHRWRVGEASFNGGLDDYAFLIRALISLFESGRGDEWLEWAIQLTNKVKENFKAEDGAFFQTDGNDPNVILKKCQFSDGAEPSGNAIQCENLLRLYQLTSDPNYLDQAEDVLRAVKKYMDSYSPGFTFHLMNLLRYYDRHSPTIVIALNQKEEFRDELRHLLYRNYIPHKAIIWRLEKDEKLFKIIPYIKEQIPIENKTTMYVCHRGVCQKPINEFSEMVSALEKL